MLYNSPLLNTTFDSYTFESYICELNIVTVYNHLMWRCDVGL